jgi:hypothetical protein
MGYLRGVILEKIPSGWIKDSVNIAVYALFIFWILTGSLLMVFSYLEGDTIGTEVYLFTRVILPVVIISIVALKDFTGVRSHHRTFPLDEAHRMVLQDGSEHPLFKHFEEWFLEFTRFSNKRYGTHDLTIKYTFPKNPAVDVHVIYDWADNVCHVGLNGKAIKELSYSQAQRIERFFIQYRHTTVPPVRTHPA